MGVLGGDDDVALRAGTTCTPGASPFVFPTGDLNGIVSQKLIGNLFYYVGLRNNYESGDVSLIDAKSD